MGGKPSNQIKRERTKEARTQRVWIGDQKNFGNFVMYKEAPGSEIPWIYDPFKGSLLLNLALHINGKLSKYIAST